MSKPHAARSSRSSAGPAFRDVPVTYDEPRFDSAKWKSEKATACAPSDERRRMVDDLSDHYLKTGMSVAEVRLLLGRPDTVSPEPDGRVFWIYVTGPELIDCTTLDIGFKQNRLYWISEGQT